MNVELSELLREKKTKLSGKEAVGVSQSLASFMKDKKNKKSWTAQKLCEVLGVNDLRFVQRLLRLGTWPQPVHSFILKNERIDFPFLRKFLDESWTRSDSLIVALKRKLSDEIPRKRNSPAIYNEFEKVRKVHIKTLNYVDNMRDQIKDLKSQVKQLEEQEDVDRLHREIKMLKDTLKSVLTQGNAPKSIVQTEFSPDQQYIIDSIRNRYGGIRATMNYKTHILLLECLSEDGFEKIVNKLIY